ncbi:hypothetical protein ACP45A_18145, partial [Vibrio genomosp. F10]
GIGNYENELVLSVLSKPHEMSVLMLNRLLNGGVNEIGGRLITDILKEISVNDALPSSIRQDAKQYLFKHEK